MTNAFTTHPASRHPEVVDQHQASIAANLARRLAKAKAAQNQHLIALLEQEQQQLARQLPVAHRLFGAVTRWTQALWQRLESAIAASTTLSVEKMVGDSGAVFWRAYDPATGETLYAESESEVVDWIETSRTHGMTPGILGLWGWQHSALKQPPTSYDDAQ